MSSEIGHIHARIHTIVRTRAHTYFSASTARAVYKDMGLGLVTAVTFTLGTKDTQAQMKLLENLPQDKHACQSHEHRNSSAFRGLNNTSERSRMQHDLRTLGARCLPRTPHIHTTSNPEACTPTHPH